MPFKNLVLVLFLTSFSALGAEPVGDLKPLSYTDWDKNQWELQSDLVDIEVLRGIESSGFSLPQLLDTSSGVDFKNNKSFFQNSAPYRSLVQLLREDLTESEKNLKKNVGEKDVGVSLLLHAHRIFNPAWFESPYAHYELVGVINRMDRISFEVGASDGLHSCGELRFIYRLAYRKTAQDIAHLEGGSPGRYVDQGFSRLPLTVNVVYHSDREQGPEEALVMANALKDPYYNCRKPTESRVYIIVCLIKSFRKRILLRSLSPCKKIKEILGWREG